MIRRIAGATWLQFAAVAACLALVSCGGGGGGSSSSTAASSASTSASAAATAGNPVIVSIGANPTALTFGESSTLTWSSTNASACQASGDWSGSVATAGTRIVSPAAGGTYTYTLNCNGVANSASIVVAAAAATPVPAVSMSLEPASVLTGQTTTLTWSASNATSCTASGAWAGTKAASGSAVVTQALAGTYTYNLNCSGAGGSANASVTLAATDSASNVAQVFVDNGPAGANNIINVPFIAVSLCRPGTSICQTIDHVLVDTGSYGLRIIAPGIVDPALGLPAISSSGGKPVGECAQFVSGYLWGSVRRADVKIAGEVASSLPIQLAADAGAEYASIPSSCSSAGANLGSVAAMGANGIIGVGLFKEDCGASCVSSALAGTYYECSSSGCTAVAMPLADQVSNPVARFAVNNNGVALAMPSVAAGGATTLTGALIFGVDTQSNNNVGSAKIFGANSNGNFTTNYKGVLLTSSFIDSGSNGLFFSDASIARCFSSSGFYCPATTLSLSAVNISADGATSGTVNFTVENLEALDSSIRAALVGGTLGRGTRSRAFDWGMPFFYGRTVFVAIDGAATGHGSGPYWAY